MIIIKTSSAEKGAILLSIGPQGRMVDYRARDFTGPDRGSPNDLTRETVALFNVDFPLVSLGSEARGFALAEAVGRVLIQETTLVKLRKKLEEIVRLMPVADPRATEVLDLISELPQ